MGPGANWAKINREAVTGITGIAHMIAMIATIVSAPISAYLWPLVIAFAFTGWLLAVLVHELGHAIAGWLLGYRLWVFNVGPMTIRTRPFLISWNARIGYDAGGYVVCLPARRGVDTRLAQMLLTLGGPVASVLSFWLALNFATSAWPTAPAWAEPDATALRSMVFGFALFSLATSILTLWPHTTYQGRPNDAASLIQQLKQPRASLSGSQCAIAALTYGVPPSKWQSWMHADIEAGLASGAPSDSQATGAFVLALDKDDVAAARAAIERAPRTRDASGGAAVAEAFIAACIDHDPVRAELLLAKTRLTLSGTLLHLRNLTLVAILAQAGETAAASERLQRLKHEVFHGTLKDAFSERMLHRYGGAELITRYAQAA